MEQGVYVITFRGCWEAELHLRNDLVDIAYDGNAFAQAAICNRFVNFCLDNYDKEPPRFVKWDDPRFSIRKIRDVP